MASELEDDGGPDSGSQKVDEVGVGKWRSPGQVESTDSPLYLLHLSSVETLARPCCSCFSLTFQYVGQSISRVKTSTFIHNIGNDENWILIGNDQHVLFLCSLFILDIPMALKILSLPTNN